MKIYQVIVDKIPKNCIECPLMRLKQCGKQYSVRGSSGSMRYGLKPDKRCLLSEK